MNKRLRFPMLYLLAASMMAMTENNGRRFERPAQKQERKCKDCYFYTGGTFCKKVKHCVSKQTPANECGYFKTKTK